MLTTVHGVVAGTDSATSWAWWIDVGSSAAVMFLLAYRLTLSIGTRRVARADRRMMGPTPRPSVDGASG